MGVRAQTSRIAGGPSYPQPGQLSDLPTRLLPLTTLVIPLDYVQRNTIHFAPYLDGTENSQSSL
uniref:Uncharacterized protein n=1 Tax=Moniliophthora roreri TaxID=221103 RepID=A0A0W0EVN2_MONRR